jgi:alpha-mannosidase
MRHEIRFTPEKITLRLKEIEGLVYKQREPLPPFSFLELDYPGLSPADLDHDHKSWQEILPQTYWALPRRDFALRTTLKALQTWKKKNGDVALFLPIGNSWDFSHPEALVYLDGIRIGACDRHHQEVLLPTAFCDGREHQLVLIGWSGIGGATVGDMTNRLKMGECQIVQIHPQTRSFLATARVALGITNHLDRQNPTYYHLLTALDQALKLVDLRLPISERFYRSISAAYSCLRKGIQDAGSPLDVDLTAVGHAHIDVAWLWTLDQTRQKSRRSFTNVLGLMEQYPEFHFVQSQPQLYDYIKDDDPDIFQQIQQRVKERRWEPIGGMWVEADCNISGGESLVRQFILGRKFFKDHFGPESDSPVLWLPDVFGYAWNLPQLIKEAGLDYFFTIKIGWSQYNRLPFDSFLWQGLDGTRVLTHFSTTKNPDSAHASTYNSDASPGQILGTWLNFQNKDDAPTGKSLPLLMSYGWGDGGGGPTREMIENIQQLGDFPAAPRVKPGRVIDFFHELEALSADLPVWNGELYLEFHRGTYTTQAQNKWFNRKLEFALHDAEFLAATAALLNPDYKYPHSLFEEAWKLICLNQFHDILPGSSIKPVYQESIEQYQQVEVISNQIKDTALAHLEKQFGPDFIVNPTSFERDEPVFFNGKYGQSRPLPSYSISAVKLSEVDTLPENRMSCGNNFLENQHLRVEFDRAGDIIRIYDKIASREVVPEGGIANQWIAYEDRPLNWDAWDIDIFYDDKCWLAEPASTISVLDESPYKISLKITRKILSSKYTQWITLSRNSPRLDIRTEIDWQDQKVLLKAAFPVEVLSPEATYEIQWGNVKRPTHQNTSWDWARFETAAQKWVDLSEGGYGVSLLNDCKYGHDIQGNTIRLTLLRGTTAPDPEADQGKHEFTYSLYPHQGNWDERTIREAYALNDPLIIHGKGFTDGPESEEIFSLVSVDQANLIIETVKAADNGQGIIIRLYESQRKRGKAVLKTGFPIDAAWQTNILEENKTVLDVTGNKLDIIYRPFQIITLRLEPKEPMKP